LVKQTNPDLSLNVAINNSQPNFPHFQIERMQDNIVYRAEALRRREGKTTANDFLCVSASLRESKDLKFMTLKLTYD
jgi:hypothetical protein